MQKLSIEKIVKLCRQIGESMKRKAKLFLRILEAIVFIIKM
jgi:hypothetical protein